MWWADLDKLQQEQEAVVKKEIKAWDELHRDAWEETQVTPLAFLPNVKDSECFSSATVG